jgi:hypothetical protein
MKKREIKGKLREANFRARHWMGVAYALVRANADLRAEVTALEQLEQLEPPESEEPELFEDVAARLGL